MFFMLSRDFLKFSANSLNISEARFLVCPCVLVFRSFCSPLEQLYIIIHYPICQPLFEKSLKNFFEEGLYHFTVLKRPGKIKRAYALSILSICASLMKVAFSNLI